MVAATPTALPRVFSRNLWPVHVTVVGNFRVDKVSDASIAQQVSERAERAAAFAVRLGPRDLFGQERNIPVLLAEHPAFQMLHDSLAREIEQLPGFAAREPNAWGEGYRPHATLGAGVEVGEGDALSIRWLTLVSLQGAVARPIRAIELP